MTKILIVEDDVLMARMYQKLFTFEGYEVEMATDGQKGLDLAREHRPTLVLLDVMMPILNGIEVLDRLKQEADTRAIPVIMLTNLAGETDARTAISKGAIKYIVKSEYDPQEVAKMVKDVITGDAHDAEAGQGGTAP
jgi:CheY-like chemotaxis protein